MNRVLIDACKFFFTVLCGTPLVSHLYKQKEAREGVGGGWCWVVLRIHRCYPTTKRVMALDLNLALDRTPHTYGVEPKARRSCSGAIVFDL